MATVRKGTIHDRAWGESSEGIALLPADATEEQQMKAAFPFLPPTAGTPEAEAWIRLDLQPPVRQD